MLRKRSQDAAEAMHNVCALLSMHGPTGPTLGLQAMLQQLPEYTQCYLRLAGIAHLQGRLQEAISWVEQALQRSPDSPDALCLLGALHGQGGAVGQAAAMVWPHSRVSRG